MKNTSLTKKISRTIFKIFSNSSRKLCMNYSNSPISTLSVNLIHEMVNGYKSHQLEDINNSKLMDMDGGDAHSIWFDIETLKKFVYHLEVTTRNNVRKKKIESEDLGIRIYYTRYPEIGTWDNKYQNDLLGFIGNPIKEKYEKRHTLIMVPTLRIGKDDVDFNPTDRKTYENGLRNIEKYNPNSTTSIHALCFSKSSSNPSSKSSITSQNHGSLIPPERPDGEHF